jgi:hypothetical protein
MDIRLKIDNSNYIVSSDNHTKLIEFAGMFFSPEITIEKVTSHYVSIDSNSSKSMSNAEIQAVKQYCVEADISDFQHYETSESIGVSMADEPLKTITPIQDGLQKLITKAVNRPKAVESA